MVATIAMVAAVAMLVFLLLAELYCTLLLRRRHRNNTSPASTDPRRQGSPSYLCAFYAQGVIRAPRSFLFPTSSILNSGNQLIPSSNREAASSPDSSTAGAGAGELIYICNPMYNKREDTPFETPASSPDIETGSSGGSSPPPPMEEGASVSLSSLPSSPW
ncbi:uncharacterized protein LOC121781620 [Salvia splendens]|uniref:uncharacterized protein LOC121781620 n=1 Tax=Salvia splendens TaxID=180675 RepID=UPI001C276457|nr:uncharacterized protein LOC121781620 [Salvia splendens]